MCCYQSVCTLFIYQSFSSLLHSMFVLPVYCPTVLVPSETPASTASKFLFFIFGLLCHFSKIEPKLQKYSLYQFFILSQNLAGNFWLLNLRLWTPVHKKAFNISYLENIHKVIICCSYKLVFLCNKFASLSF